MAKAKRFGKLKMTAAPPPIEKPSRPRYFRVVPRVPFVYRDMLFTPDPKMTYKVREDRLDDDVNGTPLRDLCSSVTEIG